MSEEKPYSEILRDLCGYGKKTVETRVRAGERIRDFNMKGCPWDE